MAGRCETGFQRNTKKVEKSKLSCKSGFTINQCGEVLLADMKKRLRQQRQRRKDREAKIHSETEKRTAKDVPQTMYEDDEVSNSWQSKARRTWTSNECDGDGLGNGGGGCGVGQKGAV